MTVLKFPYGDDNIDIATPDDEIPRVISASDVVALSNLNSELIRAVHLPDAGKPLFKLLKPNDKIGIIVPDHTRKLNINILLDMLISIIEKSGVEDKQLSIMMATGTHRPPGEKELDEIIPKNIRERIKFHIHSADRDEDMIDKGVTSRGTPIRLNKWIFNQDFLILLGGIQFHYHAGFGGGRKSILCGLGAKESIMKNHRLRLNKDAPDGLEPASRSGVLLNNPIHEDLCEIAGLFKKSFIINVITNNDGEIAKIFSGDMFEAHKIGCEFYRKHFTIELMEAADTVIASAGGVPYDRTFYQGHKAYDNASKSMKQNGRLYLILKGDEGLGPTRFQNWLMDFNDKYSHINALRKKFEIVGQTAYSIRLKAERYKTIMLTSLPDEPLKKVGISVYRDERNFLEDFYAHIGKIVYYIPDAMKVLPFVKNKQEGL